jgi:starch phosphorylase
VPARRCRARITPLDSFEAFARAVRDKLSQRWIRATRTYARENSKWVYYLSVEFRCGRDLANNVLNLAGLDVSAAESLDWV